MAEPIWKRGANAGEIRVVESIDRAIQLYERWIAEERAVRRRILAACRRRAKRERADAP